MDKRNNSTKYCPDCRLELPVAAFTHNGSRRDGLSFYCRECANARQLESRRRRFGPPRTRNRQGPRVVAEGMKWCPECDAVKVFEDFPRNRSRRSGRGTYCKPCHNKLVRANRELHGGPRNYHFRRRYGITTEHFDAMLAEQHAVCAVCAEAPADQVDHDHATGRVRGLLCFNCNGALGQFRDRTDLMLRAIAYLGRDLSTPISELPEFRFSVVLGEFADPPFGDGASPAA